MKVDTPENHGLSEKSFAKLVFKGDDGKSCYTNAQHSALTQGVARGKSMLILSPTSTGKTQIACWALAHGIENRCRCVYLVTHRALARQKFEELQSLLLDIHLHGDKGAIVLANGDTVEDAAGEVPPDPLRGLILVATYEKYLALLSGSGVPSDMKGTVIVCDEIQLIGDEARGRNVEILLTLLKNAGWRQFVGLSAVLQAKDASELANWLDVPLVVEPKREKNLRYECWSGHGILSVTTDRPETIDRIGDVPKDVNLNSVSVLRHALRKGKAARPAIVFCMSKAETYKLAKEYHEALGALKGPQLSLAFEDFPQTAANALLAEYLPCKVAIHNADLMDDERHVVERALLEGKLDVVFATSTLAAGVNFPLGTAVFGSWARWDQSRREHIPIDAGEFHNMAGRAGRMGFDHAEGRVVFLVAKERDFEASKVYLNISDLPSLEPRISPEHFDQLALQLVASGICDSRKGIESLVRGTFSGLREQDKNATGFAKWPGLLGRAIDALVSEAFLVETTQGRLSSTAVGKAAAYSGLLPTTSAFLLNFSVSKAKELAKLIPTKKGDGNIKSLAYVLFVSCFSSPEFRPTGENQPTRFLPWPLDKQALFDAEPYRKLLPEPVWHADLSPINAAYLTNEWISGVPLHDLERSLPQLSAGMLRDMFRNLAWCAQGFANLIVAAVDSNRMGATRPPGLRGKQVPWAELQRLPRLLRRLSFRVSEGLPDEVLWMAQLNTEGAAFRLRRSEILELQKNGLGTPEKVMLGDKATDSIRAAVFQNARPNPQAKANWLRDAARQWKQRQRKEAAERHSKRANKCQHAKLVKLFYSAVGTDFEQAFERILSVLKIKWEKLDDKTKTGAPDYLLTLEERPPIVVELKTKEGDRLVDYGRATEVLAASEVHGHKDKFCVTLCHPGVDPSVPIVIVDCGRLSVIESPDLGEALLRLCEGTLNQQQLWQWLATPGQALAVDLPFREYAPRKH